MLGNLRIGWRFLTAERRTMAMSLGGIVFGVGFFVITQAQTSGFERLFIRTILGTNGAIRIDDRIQGTTTVVTAVTGSGPRFEVLNPEGRKYLPGVEEPRLMRTALAPFAGVTGISEVVAGTAQAATAVREAEAQLFGIRLADHLLVTDLGNQVRGGSLEDYRSAPQGLILGSGLARALDVRVGETVRLEARGEARPFRVAAIFETGVSEIDGRRIYLHLGEARSLLRRPFGATFLQISLDDPARAPAVAARMEEVTQHRARSWQQRERTWLEVFRALRVSSAVTVTCIILTAGMGMFSALAMQVLRRTKEIAILRSMGYARRDIAEIFLWQGLLVLAGGVAAGWALGAAGTWIVSQIPLGITGILRADHFVVAWDWQHYAAAAATAAVVVLTATVVPARRAARLEPAGVIRGTSQ